MTSSKARQVAALIVLVGMALVFLAPSSYAIQSATVGLYSDSSCTFSITSSNLGSTVYVKLISVSGHPDRSPFSLNIVDPGSTVVHTISPIALTQIPYCDSTGYTIPVAETTGTWSITVVDTNNANICSSVCTFTVNGAVPDVPYGALFLVIPFIVVYLMLRRRANDA